MEKPKALRILDALREWEVEEDFIKNWREQTYTLNEVVQSIDLQLDFAFAYNENREGNLIVSYYIDKMKYYIVLSWDFDDIFDNLIELSSKLAEFDNLGEEIENRMTILPKDDKNAKL